MDNFVFGIQSIIRGLSHTIIVVAGYQLFWGFTLGFFVSTVVHVFLLTEHPRNLPTILMYDAPTSFQKLNAKKADGTYSMSYSQFTKNVDKVKIVLGLAVTLFFVIIILALFKY